MKLYVVRHGETDWNLTGKICGRTDLPLNERGQVQAEEMAAGLVDKGIDLIVASPMLRARQTAAAAARTTGAPVVTDERLIEQDYGIYEGTDHLAPAFLENKGQFACRYPGGESMMDLAARLYPLLRELPERYPGKTVLLVCHGGVCRVIRTFFQDMDNETFRRYMTVNCQLDTYEIEG